MAYSEAGRQPGFRYFEAIPAIQHSEEYVCMYGTRPGYPDDDLFDFLHDKGQSILVWMHDNNMTGGMEVIQRTIEMLIV